MAGELIISISGMRGIIGENLTGDIAARYGAAFGSYLKEHMPEGRRAAVCIGRDSRPSGMMLTAAVSAGLMGVGLDVEDLGIVTTPGAGLMIGELGCAGGVVITASHNPDPYNGIKLLLHDGIAPGPGVAEEIKGRYLEGRFGYVDNLSCGRISQCENTDPVHIEKVLSIVDVKRIQSRCFKVVLDSVNGAGGRAGKKLLEALGCRVVAINYEPTGVFAHTPEPTKENLAGLCSVVADNNAAVGFAQDPDADRLAIVDEKGNYIGEEYTLALAAKCVYANKEGLAAANLSTSRMIDRIAEQGGGKVIRTPVGEANVAKAMIENGCVIGGEGNGGVIDLRVGPIRNSLVGMAMVLELMAGDGERGVSELVAEIPSYTMIKDKFPAEKSQVAALLEAVRDEYPDAKVNDSDGYRFDFDDGWLHLRSSNTEPIMRCIVEADSEAVARQYVESVRKLREKLFG